MQNVQEKLTTLTGEREEMAHQLTLIEAKIEVLKEVLYVSPNGTPAAARGNGSPLKFVKKSDAIRHAVDMIGCNFIAQDLYEFAHRLYDEVNTGDVSNALAVLKRKKIVKVVSEPNRAIGRVTVYAKR